MIIIDDIFKTYSVGTGKVNALNGISFKVDSGEYIAIMGPSGSGKSTLLHILGCLDSPTSGQYQIDTEEVSKMDDDQLAQIRNFKIGFVFQGYNLLPRYTAVKNVELPLLYQGKLDAKTRKTKVTEALNIVGLSHRMSHWPNQLSGGESQRVAIARALVTNPAVILADEPTGNLDSKSGTEIISLFNRLNTELKATIVMVTHDENVAKNAHRTIRLKDGNLVK